MTLEDFFTLTEMKDGLTAPSRVHELVAVIQKEKDCVVKNVGDATRQWGAVASTIAATENKDCLDLFIQLDGLLFIDKWLKDAQRFSNDANDSFTEESIAALLRALEKLQIDRESSISSGISITVNSLLDHNNSRVKDRARALFDSWEPGKVVDEVHPDFQSVEALQDISGLTRDSTRPEASAIDTPVLKGKADLENNAAKTTEDEIQLSKISSSPYPERAEGVQIQTHKKELISCKVLDTRHLEARTPDPLTSSVIPICAQESPVLKAKSPTSTVEGATCTETQKLTFPKDHIVEPDSDAPQRLSNSPDRSGVITPVSCDVEPGTAFSSTKAASAGEIVPEEPILQNNIDVKEGNFCLSTTEFNVTAAISTSNVQEDAVGIIDRCNSQAFNSMAKDGESSSNTLQDLYGKDGRLEKLEELGAPFSRRENIRAADADREHSSDGTEDLREVSDFSKPALDSQSADLADRRRSNIELEYGIVDALEVARQVAQEVEREVERELVDCREPSCSSSSERIMESGTRRLRSPDSTNREGEPSAYVPSPDMPTRQDQSAEAHPVEGGCLASGDVDNKSEIGMKELESSKVPEVAQEPEVNTEKGICGFDLNLEVCSDDMDRPLNPMSAPISVVSASRPVAASCSPAAPLQFEGTLGWKGSAATSAFRPASPRRIYNGDKTHETGATSSGSKQRLDCLNIDLNIAEGSDEKVIDLTSAKQIPVSSGLHSGESSMKVSPKRSERPNLDLNCISHDGEAPMLDMRTEGQLFYPRNGHRSPSPASSSSTMQNSLRNFDLNDRPLFHNDSSDHGLFHGEASQSISAYGSNPGDPVISIMGTRVEVGSRGELERKDFIQQAPSLPNGKPLEPAMDANVARMGGVLGMVPTVSYTHSPAFGYNGLAPASNMPISPPLYGPGGSIPYVVDSRGAPVVPQIVGSASAVAQYSQPPFIMSMAGAPLGLNGVGPSRPNFDLNSGFAIEGGSTGGLRQFFMTGPGRYVEEHMRANSEPSSSSGVGGKRKEPESGWEPYSLNYKHPQAPWR